MNVKIGYNVNLTAGFWWNNSLIMNNYSITFKLLTLTADPTDQNIALDRLKFMFSDVFTDIIFIVDSEKDQIKKLKAANLRLAILPEEPVDQIIGMMLYSKISAIMEDKISIRSLMISSEAGDNVIYEHDIDESVAPFDQPGWWSTSGPECESVARGRDKVVEIGHNKHWREFGLEWADQQVEVIDDTNVLVFNDYKNDTDK